MPETWFAIELATLEGDTYYAMCWANYGTDSNGKVSSSSCTPVSHGRDGYAW